MAAVAEFSTQRFLAVLLRELGVAVTEPVDQLAVAAVTVDAVAAGMSSTAGGQPVLLRLAARRAQLAPLLCMAACQWLRLLWLHHQSLRPRYQYRHQP